VSAKELAVSYENSDPFLDIRIRELASYIDLSQARVLDVGFGRASFLFCLKKLGAVPYGLEVDTRAIEYAKSLGILNVFPTSLDDYVSDIKFDVITMLDLIEHPFAPMKMLQKASDLLRPGGLLLIWTPNGESVRFDGKQVAFRVDLEHMQYLTAESCLFIADRLNLRILHLETLGFPDLSDIDKPFRKRHTGAVKKTIRSMPGFSTLNRIRRTLFVEKPDERRGLYHLFVIMQKSD
jgi:2-polyprenyl-3-methyl-5-hydroxy-6-metoxy-1,4-benzoquinol methylase